MGQFSFSQWHIPTKNNLEYRTKTSIAVLHQLFKNESEFPVFESQIAMRQETIPRLTSDYSIIVSEMLTYFFPHSLQKFTVNLLHTLETRPSEECHILCLEALRILSREKRRMHQLTGKDSVYLLLKLAGLSAEPIEVTNQSKLLFFTYRYFRGLKSLTSLWGFKLAVVGILR